MGEAAECVLVGMPLVTALIIACAHDFFQSFSYPVLFNWLERDCSTSSQRVNTSLKSLIISLKVPVV